MNTIDLRPEQQLILDGPHPVRARDPRTNATYVLVREEAYQQLRPLLDNELPDAASLMNEVMADDDANDPLLSSYQHLSPDRP